jgi:glyoxylase-like metal-dependent hydrolase (beta-lactamase superfamily II)
VPPRLEVEPQQTAVELADGIRRVTFRLPFGIDHVHCYLLRAGDGSWTLVDTAIALPDAEARWGPVLAVLDGPVERIVVTHYHPDHVGGSRDLAALTGADVFQGRLDYEQCLRVWGDDGTPSLLGSYFAENGVPAEEAELLGGATGSVQRLIRFARDPQLLDPGDRVAGWQVINLPGHADGHICLLRDGVLIAGDTILDPITPVIGLYPGARPDPLGDYLESLGRIAALAPRVAFAGHHLPISDPPDRARAIVEHHRDRLERTIAALDGGARTGYDVSLALFERTLSPPLRRFAVAESLAHLERLVREGRAKRIGGPGRTTYTSTT